MPADMTMLAAGKPKGGGGNPFGGGRMKEPAAKGGLPSPEPIGGRLKGQASLDEANYHGSEKTCGQCANFKEPNACRAHMAQVDPDFGHCDQFEGPEVEEQESGLEPEVEEERVA
jgi:hypothetical protein